jgi:hypothetical protein
VRHDEKGNNLMKIKNMIKTNTMPKYRKGLFVVMASLLLALPFPVNGGSSLTMPTSASLAAAAGFDFGSETLASQLFGLPFPFNRGLSFAPSTSPTLAAAEQSQFAILISSASGGDSFGSNPESMPGIYRGLQFTYPAFDLPGALPRNGVIVLSSFNVGNSCNRFELNGVQIPVFRDHNNSNVWETEVFRVTTNVIKPTGNILRIAAVNDNCTESGVRDNFAVSNAILYYKTQ